MSGTIKVTTLQDGGSATANLVFDTSGNATVGNNLTVTGTAAMASSFKRNYIINGNMMIAQRGTSFTGLSNSAAAATYGIDRFSYNRGNGTTGVVTMSQVSDAPPGFAYSLKIQPTTSESSIAATEYNSIKYLFEGLSVQSLAYGTSSASATTLSFWIKSSVTGNFPGVLFQTQSSTGRTWPFYYTVSAANTWQYVTVNIAADPSGSIPNTNTGALEIDFYFGLGSSYTNGTAGSWNTNVSSNSFAPTGVSYVNLLASTSNTFQITGVQFELGTKATPYEMQIYSDQLAQCQRYYVQLSSSGALYASLGTGICNSSSSGQGFVVRLPVTMRTQPTASFNAMRVYDGASAATILSFSSVSSCSSANALGFDASCSGTVLTTGRPLTIQGNYDATAYIAASAEL